MQRRGRSHRAAEQAWHSLARPPSRSWAGNSLIFCDATSFAGNLMIRILTLPAPAGPITTCAYFMAVRSLRPLTHSARRPLQHPFHGASRGRRLSHDTHSIITEELTDMSTYYTRGFLAHRSAPRCCAFASKSIESGCAHGRVVHRRWGIGGGERRVWTAVAVHVGAILAVRAGDVVL